ncbi:hypothetical protein PInf_024709 [Phytophthora infestans]|nr:hypothetical protein PInf_024709 [Phytophthora infestans]
MRKTTMFKALMVEKARFEEEEARRRNKTLNFEAERDEESILNDEGEDYDKDERVSCADCEREDDAGVDKDEDIRASAQETISVMLKDSDLNLNVRDEDQHVRRSRRLNFPKLDEALANWVL